MSFGIIYKAENKVNGKVYIGQTVNDLNKRIICHFSEAKLQRYSSVFHKAIRKYGRKSFIWEILEYCDTKEEMDEMEYHYIIQYNSYLKGYNLTLGGEGSPGNIVSDKVRLKISNSTKGNKAYWYGRNHTEETKQKLSNIFSGKGHPNYGKNRDRSIVDKIAVSNKGQKRSLEQRKRMSEAHIPRFGKDNPGSKKFVITTPNNNMFIIDGLINFCRFYEKEKLNFKNLSQCATGEKRHHKGFKCRYFDEVLDKNIPKWEDD